MKFTTDSKVFAVALAQVKPVAASRNISIPILGNVLIECADNELTLTCNNLDAAIVLRGIACATDKPGAITLPHVRLLQSVSALGGELLVEADKKSFATLRRGESVIRLAGLPASDFAAPPVSVDDPAKVEIDLATFTNLVGKVVNFASVPAQARPNLECVSFQSSEHELHLVATDGRRLATAKIDAVASKPFAASIPSNSVRAVLSLAGEGAINVEVGSTAIKLQCGNWTFYCALLADHFPNWRQVIPDASEFPYELVFNRDEMLDAVAASGATAADSKSRRVDIATHNGTLTVACDGGDIGRSEIAIPRRNKGKELRFAIDARFFSDSLRVCDKEEIALRTADLSPIVIQEPNLITVTMPLRTGG